MDKHGKKYRLTNDNLMSSLGYHVYIIFPGCVGEIRCSVCQDSPRPPLGLRTKVYVIYFREGYFIKKKKANYGKSGTPRKSLRLGRAPLHIFTPRQSISNDITNNVRLSVCCIYVPSPCNGF